MYILFTLLKRTNWLNEVGFDILLPIPMVKQYFKLFYTYDKIWYDKHLKNFTLKFLKKTRRIFFKIKIFSPIFYCIWPIETIYIQPSTAYTMYILIIYSLAKQKKNWLNEEGFDILLPIPMVTQYFKLFCAYDKVWYNKHLKNFIQI